MPEGDDIDDEDFKIRIIYKIFERSSYSSSESLEVTGEYKYILWMYLSLKYLIVEKTKISNNYHYRKYVSSRAKGNGSMDCNEYSIN